jgi:hypothetical protein
VDRVEKVRIEFGKRDASLCASRSHTSLASLFHCDASVCYRNACVSLSVNAEKSTPRTLFLVNLVADRELFACLLVES